MSGNDGPGEGLHVHFFFFLPHRADTLHQAIHPAQ